MARQPKQQSKPASCHQVIAKLYRRCPELNRLDRARLLRCIQLFVEAESASRNKETRTADFSGFIEAGLPTLLVKALACMAPEAALHFCETENLATYRQRSQAARVLADPITPLYSLQELTRLTAQFLDHQERNRDALISTGHPVTHFGLSAWFDTFLNKLYYTKVPIKLIESPGLGGRIRHKPFIPIGYAEWPLPGTSVANYVPSLIQNWHVSYQYEGEPFPQLERLWARRRVSGRRRVWAPCSYENADRVAGISEADEKRLANLRPKLFQLKIRLLTEAHRVLLKQNASDLWSKCSGELIELLRGDDAEFLLSMDQVYAGHNLMSSKSKRRSVRVPFMVGGLTNMLEFLGFIEKELKLGTLTKTRVNLNDMVTIDALSRPRLLAEPACERYLALVFRGNFEKVRQAIDTCFDLGTQEPVFWANFRERAVNLLMEDLRVPAHILVPRKFLGPLSPLVQKQADMMTKQFEEGQLAMFEASSTKQNIFRFDGSDWTVSYDGGKVFALRQSPGFFYIAFLLDHPKKWFGPSELSEAYTSFRRPPDVCGIELETADDLALEACLGAGADDLGEVANKVGVAAIYRVLHRIKQDLNNADRAGDVMGKAQLTAEKEKLESFFSEIYRPGGKFRKLKDRIKRIRDAVFIAIDRALEKIREKSPALHRHLRNSLKYKGHSLSSYEPETTVRWNQ